VDFYCICFCALKENAHCYVYRIARINLDKFKNFTCIRQGRQFSANAWLMHSGKFLARIFRLSRANSWYIWAISNLQRSDLFCNAHVLLLINHIRISCSKDFYNAVVIDYLSIFLNSFLTVRIRIVSALHYYKRRAR